MDKSDAIYAVILAVSLFSLSLLLFSQGITNLYVSIKDEQPLAVSVPTMFSINHVFLMLFFTVLGSHSFTILSRDMFIIKEKLKSEINVEESTLSSCEKSLRTPYSNSNSESSGSSPLNEGLLASHEAQFPVSKPESPCAGIPSSIPGSSSDVPEPLVSAKNSADPVEIAESGMAESNVSVNQNPLNTKFDMAEHKKQVALEILQGDEKSLFVIISEKEEILQSDLVLESGFSKVKVSRLLQKLERKSLVKRKPFGNTNKVILAK